MLARKDFRELDKLLDEIYTACDDLGWSWTVFAEKANIAISTVYNIGMYRTRYPHASTVFQLAKAVGFKVTLVRTKYKLKVA